VQLCPPSLLTPSPPSHNVPLSSATLSPGWEKGFVCWQESHFPHNFYQPLFPLLYFPLLSFSTSACPLCPLFRCFLFYIPPCCFIAIPAIVQPRFSIPTLTFSFTVPPVPPLLLRLRPSPISPFSCIPLPFFPSSLHPSPLHPSFHLPRLRSLPYIHSYAPLLLHHHYLNISLLHLPSLHLLRYTPYIPSPTSFRLHPPSLSPPPLHPCPSFPRR
jgi:hypothetical protein